MLTIVVVCLGIFWLVQSIIIDDLFWAAIITGIIIFLFVNIDIDKEIIKLKTEVEIKQSIDKARNIAIGTVEKAGEVSIDVEEAFEKGKKNVETPKENMTKIDLDSLNFPDAQYLDLSMRSRDKASFYKTDDGVVACLNSKTNNCFKNIVIRTHSDNTRYICKGIEKCYRGE